MRRRPNVELLRQSLYPKLSVRLVARRPTPTWFRRQLNVKLLIGFLVGGTLLGTGVHFRHEQQVQHNAAALLRQADRATEQGNHARAASYLNRYLALVPNDHEARFKLALTHDRLAKRSRDRYRALELLEHALQHQPGRHDMRRRAVNIAMDLKRFSDAVQHLKILRDATPDDPEVDYLLGQCHEANREYVRAVERYERAAQRSPNRVESYVRCAGLLRRQLDQARRADQVMDDMVLANSQSFPAYLERGRYRREFSLAGAAQDFSRARELARQTAPRDATQLLAAAELAQDGNDRVEARSYLERGLELHPRDVRLHRALGRLELQAGRPHEALAHVRRGLSALPEAKELLPLLADALIQSGEWSEAAQVIALLRTKGLPPAHLEYLEANLLVHKGDWVRAVRTLERAREQLPATSDLGPQIDLLLGACYEQLDEPERQLACYRRAALRDPLGAAASTGLVATLLTMGKIDEALDEYQRRARARGREPDPVTLWTTLAALLEGRRKPEKAVGVLEEAARRLGDRAEWRAERGRLLAAAVLGALRRGKADEARAWAGRLEQLEPGSFRTAEVKARLLLTRGKPGETAALLKEYVRGKDADARLAVALLDELGCADAAGEIYREHLPRRLKRSETVLTLAGYLGGQKRREEALDLCDRAWPTCTPTAVAAVALDLLRDGPADDKQCQRVERRLQAALEAYRESPALLVCLADLRDLQGRYVEAEAVYRRALDRDSRQIVALNNLAWLLAFRDGKGPEALELIDRAINLAGPQPALRDTRAIVHLSQGLGDLAVRDLEAAVEGEPTATRYFHLARAYRMAGRPADALDAFRRAEAAGARGPGLHPLERAGYQEFVSWARK